MKYGYARVSTQQQDLEVQLQQLISEKCEIIYKEKFTGTKMERVEFKKLLSVINDGDILVVTKLDRLARNTKEGIEIIDDLFQRNIKVHVLNIGLLENTTLGRFFLQTMLAVAEMERNMIIERTQEGKQLAKQKRGFKEGRPKKFSRQQIKLALDLLENHSYKEVEAMTGISISTLQRAKRAIMSKTLCNSSLM